MKQLISVCGCDCSACEYLKKSKCEGCSEIEGKVWWVKYISADICPVYNCVIKQKELDNCGVCPEIPCSLWRDLKDPSLSDQQHEEYIKVRIENLKNETGLK